MSALAVSDQASGFLKDSCLQGSKPLSFFKDYTCRQNDEVMEINHEA